MLRVKFSPEAVAITAPTGIAGINIGGCTLHSFAGIGLGNEDAKRLADRISHSQKLKDRWVNTKTLIIDEGMKLDCHLW
jgi:ATP-dependent DNA helicase PIF1